MVGTLDIPYFVFSQQTHFLWKRQKYSQICSHFALCFFLAGNILIILAVTVYKDMHTPTNYFLGSLAFGDFSVSCLLPAHRVSPFQSGLVLVFPDPKLFQPAQNVPETIHLFKSICFVKSENLVSQGSSSLFSLFVSFKLWCTSRFYVHSLVEFTLATWEKKAVTSCSGQNLHWWFHPFST